MAAADSTKRDKRKLISEAAIEVFAEKGFNQARISDVSKRAGVADGTIYLYYKNKDDLLLSIFEDAMQLLFDGVKNELDKVDGPSEKIRTFVHTHFALVGANRSLAAVLQVELRQSNKFFKGYRPEILWRYLGLLADIVRDGQESGEFRQELDPFVQMWSIFGALDELGMQWVLARRRKIDLKAAAEQVAETFIRGMNAHS